MKKFLQKNLLVVGQSGSGKSNFIDNLVVSFINDNDPKDFKLMLFDPKKVQFSQYENIPHLLSKIVSDQGEAKMALAWLCEESTRRIQDTEKQIFNSITVIIEELADYVMPEREFFEDCIEKITASSDITKIYFVIATSRPSFEYVLTEKIINCFTTRICFRYPDKKVSLHILGRAGAETLTTPGSCLIKNEAISEIENLQLTHISDDEINGITKSILSK